MSLITDFKALPAWELQRFAEGLVHKVNAECIFSKEVDFKIEEVEVHENGDLVIGITNDDRYVPATVEASWSCSDEDEIYSPEDPDIEGSTLDALEQSFVTFSANVDGYDVELTIDDYDKDDIQEVDVTSTTAEDAGIGSYEYWGHIGYDSRPYLEVEGTITYGCVCYMTLWVAPAK